MKRKLIAILLPMLMLTACSKEVEIPEPTDIVVEETVAIETAVEESVNSTGERVVSPDEVEAVNDFMAEYVNTLDYVDSNPLLLKVNKWLTPTPKVVEDMKTPNDKTARAIAAIQLMDKSDGQNTSGKLHWDDLLDLANLFGFNDMSELWQAWEIPVSVDFGTIADTSSFQSSWSPASMDFFFNEPGDVTLYGDSLKLARDAEGNVMLSQGTPIKTAVGNFWVIVPGMTGAVAQQPVFWKDDITVAADWNVLVRDCEDVIYGTDVPYVCLDTDYLKVITEDQFAAVEQYVVEHSEYDYASLSNADESMATLDDLFEKYCK